MAATTLAKMMMLRIVIRSKITPHTKYVTEPPPPPPATETTNPSVPLPPLQLQTILLVTDTPYDPPPHLVENLGKTPS